MQKTAKEDTNWVTDGVKATVGHASKVHACPCGPPAGDQAL